MPLCRVLRTRRGVSKLPSDSSGAAAIEMAIVLPLFLTVVFGILAYGIYLGAAHSTQQLAADAARVSIAGLTPEERTSLASSFVRDHAGDYPLLWPEHVAIKAGPSAGRADDFLVVVTYDARVLPIWNLAPFLPLPAEQIERVAVVRRGGTQ